MAAGPPGGLPLCARSRRPHCRNLRIGRKCMTRKPVGIGIVGLGFMGRRYARFVSQIEGTRVAGVCDLNQALAAEVADESGGRIYADPCALATSPDVEAVIVCTPEHLHLDP